MGEVVQGGGQGQSKNWKNKKGAGKGQQPEVCAQNRGVEITFLARAAPLLMAMPVRLVKARTSHLLRRFRRHLDMTLHLFRIQELL